MVKTTNQNILSHINHTICVYIYMYNCTCTDKYICITICITGIFNVYKHVTSGYHHPFTGLQKRCCPISQNLCSGIHPRILWESFPLYGFSQHGSPKIGISDCRPSKTPCTFGRFQVPYGISNNQWNISVQHAVKPCKTNHPRLFMFIDVYWVYRIPLGSHGM